MSNKDFSVSKISLAYAKIVATPTSSSWSQVYNAGSLFAVLSLFTKDNPENDVNLPSIGKEILNNLEAEFFTLEEKTLNAIKSATEKGFSNLPPEITANACLAFFKENILYLFILGKGKIIMKRKEKIGTLLAENKSDTQLITASGYLNQGDIILLQTDNFAQNISDKNIIEAFEFQLPNDIAESLTPHVHQKEDGGQAAIIIAYNGAPKTLLSALDNIDPVISPAAEDASEYEEKEKKEEIQIKNNKNSPPFLSSFLKSLKIPKISLPNLTLVQKTSLAIGALLLIILAVSIFLTKKNQEDTKRNALFQQVMQSAQKYFDEGKSLKKLNQPLANNDLLRSEKIIENNLGKFKNNSTEYKKLQALLIQTKAEIKGTTTKINKISPQNINAGENTLLSLEKKEKAISYTQDSNNVYQLTSNAISEINKTNGSKKTIIENDKDWSSAVDLCPYQGNIYVLDKKNGIIKFIPAQNTYAKTSYFKGKTPDLSKARSLAIDGSIWILLSDGKILKYTKGDEDNFTISGIDKPFANPIKISTNVDTDYLYVLDPGNGRIIKISKNGTFEKQYTADVLLNAVDFEIIEKDNQALILSNGKIYGIPLN